MALSGSGGSLLTVDNAWLVLGEVELQSGENCAAEHVDIDGLGAGDHAATQAPPTEFASEPGKYCGISLPFAPSASELPNGVPASLKKESVFVRGKLPDGREFEIHSELQESLSLRATAGEFVLDSNHRSVVIGFDVAHWLSQLSWDDASTVDGAVIVSESSNRALLEQFEAALPSGVALFRDHDNNGEMDIAPEQLAVTKP
jgi:hypothetical protein